MNMQRRGFLQLMAGLFAVPLIPKLALAQEPEAPKPVTEPEPSFGPPTALPDGFFAWYADVFALIECYDEQVKAVYIPTQYHDALITSDRMDHTKTDGTWLWGAQVVWCQNDWNLHAMGKYHTTVQGGFMRGYKELITIKGHQ